MKQQLCSERLIFVNSMIRTREIPQFELCPHTSSICDFRLWKHKTVQKKTTAYAGDSRNPTKFLSSTSTFQQLQNVVRNLVIKEDQQDYKHTDRQEKAPNVCCPVPPGQNDDGHICTSETLSY